MYREKQLLAVVAGQEEPTPLPGKDPLLQGLIVPPHGGESRRPAERTTHSKLTDNARLSSHSIRSLTSFLGA